MLIMGDYSGLYEVSGSDAADIFKCNYAVNIRGIVFASAYCSSLLGNIVYQYLSGGADSFLKLGVGNF